MQSTGPSYLTSANEVINEAAKHNYVFNGIFAGKGAERSIQGGNQINDVIMFDTGSTYSHYKPNETFSWSMPQVTDTVNQHWRFIVDHMAWTDAEIELNMTEGATRDTAKAQYKKLKHVKEQRLWTSMLNGMEEDLFKPAIGNDSDMEGASGSLPASIFTYITEICKGSSTAAITVDDDIRGTLPLGWSSTTTVQGLDPRSDSVGSDASTKWTNQISCYKSATNAGPAVSTAADANAAATNVTISNNDIEGTDGVTVKAGGLFPAFDEMFYKVQYRAPNKYADFFEDTSFQSQLILCSRAGINAYKSALRSSNDRLLGVGQEDAGYLAPTYAGVPLNYVSQLDSTAAYPLGAGVVNSADIRNRASGSNGVLQTTAGGTETATNIIDSGPRYYFIHGDYLNMFFHARRYMVKHEVLRHPNQPFTYVQPVDCWMNLFCRSRSRLGVIKPVCTG